MNPILLAVLIVGGVALAAGLVLAIASVVLAVPVDERAVKLREALPGANCGGCGYSGCDAYAAALADGSAPAGLCSPGGEVTARALAAILGGDATVERKVAVVRCGGCAEHTAEVAVYDHVTRCAEAARLGGGETACAYGCLGLGDCAAVCPAGAIAVENGLARVDDALCIGCGKCTAACPKGLTALVPAPKKALVACRNADKGALTRRVCTAGCIGCGKCVKTCPVGAAALNGALAAIDPALCTGCGACAEACPVGCIAAPAVS